MRQIVPGCSVKRRKSSAVARLDEHAARPTTRRRARSRAPRARRTPRRSRQVDARRPALVQREQHRAEQHPRRRPPRSRHRRTTSRSARTPPASASRAASRRPRWTATQQPRQRGVAEQRDRSSRFANTTTYGFSTTSTPGHQMRDAARAGRAARPSAARRPTRRAPAPAPSHSRCTSHGGSPSTCAEREERPHREQVAAVLAALHVPEARVDRSTARRRRRGSPTGRRAGRSSCPRTPSPGRWSTASASEAERQPERDRPALQAGNHAAGRLGRGGRAALATRLRVVRRAAPADGRARRRPPPLPAVRGAHHRPVAVRRRARARLRRLVPARVGPLLGPGRRAAAAHARSLWRRASTAVAPPGPVLDVGAGDGALLDALAAPRPRGGRARAATPRRADVGRGRHRRARRASCAAIVFWHSLEHLPRPGAALAARRRAARARRRAGRRRARTPTASRRGSSATAGSRSTCRATSCTSRPRTLVAPPASGSACAWSASATGAAARSCSAGCTASSARCRAAPTSTTRSAGPRRAARPLPPARRAPPSPPRPLLLPLAAPRARREVGAAARRHRLRGGAPWLSGRRRQGDRRDAGVNAARTLERTVEAIPRDVGRRGDPGRRHVHRRHGRARPRACRCT